MTNKHYNLNFIKLIMSLQINSIPEDDLILLLDIKIKF